MAQATHLSGPLAVLAERAGRGYENGLALPGAFYTDPDVLALEREKIFAREWICAGRLEEVEKPGDYFTFGVAGEPLVIVRGRDKRLRAFSNVCRHRGARLAEGAGNLRAFVCPYHNWCYDLSGKLTSAPGIAPRADFDPKTCRLPEVALETWMGFIFVSLATDPPDFAARVAGLSDMIAPYHLEEMHLKYLAEETWPVNWKALLENFMEGYHLSPLHKTTLAPVNPSKLCKHFTPGAGYFGYSVGFATRVRKNERVGHPDLSDAALNTCLMAAVTPAMAMGVGSDYASFLSLIPEAPDRVRAKMGLYFYGEDWAQADIDRAVALFHETMAEDKQVLIGAQQGLGSRFYAPGPLAGADLEGPIADFHRYLAEALAV